MLPFPPTVYFPLPTLSLQAATTNKKWMFFPPYCLASSCMSQNQTGKALEPIMLGVRVALSRVLAAGVASSRNLKPQCFGIYFRFFAVRTKKRKRCPHNSISAKHDSFYWSGNTDVWRSRLARNPNDTKQKMNLVREQRDPCHLPCGTAAICSWSAAHNHKQATNS